MYIYICWTCVFLFVGIDQWLGANLAVVELGGIHFSHYLGCSQRHQTMGVTPEVDQESWSQKEELIDVNRSIIRRFDWFDRFEFGCLLPHSRGGWGLIWSLEMGQQKSYLVWSLVWSKSDQNCLFDHNHENDHNQNWCFIIPLGIDHNHETSNTIFDESRSDCWAVEKRWRCACYFFVFVFSWKVMLLIILPKLR